MCMRGTIFVSKLTRLCHTIVLKSRGKVLTNHYHSNNLNNFILLLFTNLFRTLSNICDEALLQN